VTNLDYYLTQAHSTRGRTMLLSVVAGAAVGMFSEWLNTPRVTSVSLCVLVIGAIEIGRAWRYVQPTEKKKRVDADLPSTIRRTLILTPVALLLFFVVAFLPVPRLEAAIIERKLKKNAEHPYNPQSMKETSHTLIHAEVENINLRPTVVESAGKKFLNAADGNPSAWNTTVQFLNYKSFLNVSLTIESKNVLPVGTHLETRYNLRWPKGTTQARFSVSGAVPRDQAAQFAVMGLVDPDASIPIGNDWIIATDGAITLDNMLMKKVIFRNVQIFYEGGPLIMHGVYFLSCTFNIIQSPNGQRFVLAALKPAPATDFEAS
jgi:hypothetical protein